MTPPIDIFAIACAREFYARQWYGATLHMQASLHAMFEMKMASIAASSAAEDVRRVHDLIHTLDRLACVAASE